MAYGTPSMPKWKYFNAFLWKNGVMGICIFLKYVRNSLNFCVL